MFFGPLTYDPDTNKLFFSYDPPYSRGVGTIFWVWGHFPAKLFGDMGRNGQLKINWAVKYDKIFFREGLVNLKKFPGKPKLVSKKKTVPPLRYN